jgi:hypothetical protein
VISFAGTTCLYVAAKSEEIYPPRVQLFAYISWSCNESILKFELHLTDILQWLLNPITPVAWVSIYLQVAAYRSQGVYCTRSRANAIIRSAVLFPEVSKPNDPMSVTECMYDMVEFVKVMRIVDLATLDTDSVRFTYSTIAAAAVLYVKGIIIIRTYYFKHHLSIHSKWPHSFPHQNVFDRESICPRRIRIQMGRYSTLRQLDGPLCFDYQTPQYSNCIAMRGRD